MKCANTSKAVNRIELSFKRDRLPIASQYYSRQGIIMKGGGAWKSALCPFHKDTKPSLRIHIATGAFKCMACGAHGGDVIAFHRLRYQLGFIDAARALGVWEMQR